MKFIYGFISYTFAAISGICLIGGIAVLNKGKEKHICKV
jgi:hypothetical protein